MRANNTRLGSYSMSDHSCDGGHTGTGKAHEVSHPISVEDGAASQRREQLSWDLKVEEK